LLFFSPYRWDLPVHLRRRISTNDWCCSDGEGDEHVISSPVTMPMRRRLHRFGLSCWTGTCICHGEPTVGFRLLRTCRCRLASSIAPIKKLPRRVDQHEVNRLRTAGRRSALNRRRLTTRPLVAIKDSDCGSAVDGFTTTRSGCVRCARQKQCWGADNRKTPVPASGSWRHRTFQSQVRHCPESGQLRDNRSDVISIGERDGPVVHSRPTMPRKIRLANLCFMVPSSEAGCRCEFLRTSSHLSTYWMTCCCCTATANAVLARVIRGDSKPHIAVYCSADTAGAGPALSLLHVEVSDTPSRSGTGHELHQPQAPLIETQVIPVRLRCNDRVYQLARYM